MKHEPNRPPWFSGRVVFCFLFFLFRAYPSLAHDIPDERVDRSLQIQIEPARLTIDYEVSLGELTAIQDLRRLSGPISGLDRSQLLERYGAVLAPLNARGIVVELNKKPLALVVERHEVFPDQHPRYLFRFSCALPSSGRLKILDQNYLSSEGISRLAVHPSAEILMKGYAGPELVEQASSDPVWMLDDEQERARHEAAFEFETRETTGEATSSSVSPAGFETEKSSQDSEFTLTLSGLTQRISQLLGPEQGWARLRVFFLSVFLGAAHAFQPGHGKTLVAFSSVASRRQWAGLVLALSTTITHMASVFAITIFLWATGTTRYASIQAALIHTTGFCLAAIGMFRVGQAIGGPAVSNRPVLTTASSGSQSYRSLALLGLLNGIVPCWDAVFLVLLAGLADRLLWGIMLLAGFSLGMAIVLVGVGLSSSWARERLADKFQTLRVDRLLSLGAGLALLMLGGYFWLQD